MIRPIIIVFVLGCCIETSNADHFRGAMIYWKQSTTDRDVIDLEYRQAWRWSWTDDNFRCNDTTIALGLLASAGSLDIRSERSLTYTSTASFAFQCTDYSLKEDWETGKGHSNFTPSSVDPLTDTFYVRFSSCCWILTLNDMKGPGWSLLAVVNTSIRSDTGRMNQSPRVDIPPIIRLQYGCNHTIRIPVSDVDGDDIRCRWSQQNNTGYDECDGACHTFTHAVINARECTITYEAVYKLGWYAVAVQIEDFSSKTSATPLSSIPLQFLVSVENNADSCASYEREKPTFIGFTMPDKACIGVNNGTDFTSDIYIDSKSNSSISELNTLSPIGLVKSSLQQVNASGMWHISVTWNPDRTDSVNNVFCFTAVDTNGLSSDQRCVTLLAGVPPALILPSSKNPPTQVVSKHQHQWSIEFDQFANAATRPAYIYLYLANGTLKETVDVYNQGSTYTNGSHGTVLHFTTTTTLEGGHEYYFLFGQGLVQGHSYCGAESAAVLDTSFWRFSVEPNPLTGVNVVCERQSVIVPCTQDHFNCSDTWTFPNPCTKEMILVGNNNFSHPFAMNKFLLCDHSGKLYIAYCPPGENYYPGCSKCAAPELASQVGCGEKVSDVNPCTREAILADKMFFAHPHSPTKYIHCDIWGRAWEQDCNPGEIWDQVDVTCIVPTDVSPCKQHGILGQTLFPHCDPHKYIHCDGLGQSFVQSCQLDYIFLPASLTCVPPGFYPGTENLRNTCV